MGRKRTEVPGTDARRAAAASIEPRGNIDAANLHLGRFFVRYLLDVSREFDGDLQLAILAGEIGHHNVSQHYSCESVTVRRSGRGAGSPSFWNHLEPCNAYSLASSTGIPRETVRRKISTLVRKGWISRTERGDLFITPALVAHFVPNFNKNLMNEVLTLADELRAILSGRASSAGNLPTLADPVAKPQNTAGGPRPKPRVSIPRRGGHGRPKE